MTALIIIALVFGSGYFLLSRSKKSSNANFGQFYHKGKEAGFSNKEIEMLQQIASQNNIQDPISIFLSQVQLDICIRSIVRNIGYSGTAEDQSTHDFLSKLFDFRKNIELNKHSNKNGISNTRQINEGQVLKILVAGAGVYRSQVVKNTYQYMTISRPVNSKNSPAISWEGNKISVYFWREDDAGYVFDSAVTDEVFSLGISSLKINHSEQLFRTQKRSSIRIKINKPAFLYLVPENETSYFIETSPGLRCLLDDISDTGCAVIVGGKGEAGLRVKIQFSLKNIPLCMIGTVRTAIFKEDKNETILRIEADNLPMETRNQILMEVFGVSPDDDADNDEDLPFKILDDEAAKVGTQKEPAGIEPVFRPPDIKASDEFADAAFPADFV